MDGEYQLFGVCRWIQCIGQPRKDDVIGMYDLPGRVRLFHRILVKAKPAADAVDDAAGFLPGYAGDPCQAADRIQIVVIVRHQLFVPGDGRAQHTVQVFPLLCRQLHFLTQLP